MGRVYDDDLSVNECPYTGRICYKWECETCEIEQEERKYMQASYEAESEDKE